ncbi:hypothetical protein [Bacillus solitudinis]|nr:hypothetical protein [Bacillus solitudinis]
MYKKKTVAGTIIEEVRQANNHSGLTYNEVKQRLAQNKLPEQYSDKEKGI